MSEKLNNSPENVQEASGKSDWDNLSEVPFRGAEQIDKKQADRKEYLDILVEVGDGMQAENVIGENGVNLVAEEVDGDKAKYESHFGEMQTAAKIIDAEMIRRKSESAYYDLATKLASLPEDALEERNAITATRDSAKERMQAAHNLAQEELRKAYPDLNDREASKKFFGYESWAINPLELSSVSGGENDGKVYDTNHKEVSSERKPDNQERVEMINKAIEIRSNMHGAVYSDNISDEVGVFKRGEI
ncbi:hypothetical protein IKE84_00075 [Candidatus Saccharibacteria bacterium]|nr:hypothetical protein [Candidatus Saccharibacteria bacterium]